MKRPFTVVVLALICLLLLIIGMGSFGRFVLKPRETPQMAQIPEEAFDALKKSQDATRSGGAASATAVGTSSTSLTIESSAAFSIQNATNTSVTVSSSVRDGQSSASVTLELSHPDPAMLTHSAYENIKPGMKYPEIAIILGGELPKGRLADGFSGTFTVINGKRQIALTFRNSVVESKSATGLD